ncbi:MAG: ABC transporter ATP-binding protein [Gammaproteobacteria bacterium]|nr:ABC transporter ATP-binding protein [Gammaproteobacteria bacterium]MDH3362503.1 ABC transporter ATP-binding protein [Gammaproteobacteria bacterium]MDH3480088.1 ABC transporter ATP-binding protein [Gammaproteobacteria bacterium]
MQTVIDIRGLTKTYAGGFEALKNVSLSINKSEIFALLGPNGAGKTTLINIVCGITRLTRGKVLVDGHDIISDFRLTRAKIGLVPQEMPTESFETVWNTCRFSRGLFGKPASPEYLEKVLKWLSLWDKKDTKSLELSGGMKRRVLIAKALAHQPEILFLDEPTAGVDVELRQDMWNVVKALRGEGVTVILTTHYIEEAEQLADRVGVINHGEIILVEEKEKLMREMGKKQLMLHLYEQLDSVPQSLSKYDLELTDNRQALVYNYDTKGEHTGITDLISDLRDAEIRFNDLQTSQSSLEDIFVDLVRKA